MFRRCGDLIRITTSAAPAEPELDTVIKEGRRRHTMGTRLIAQRMADLDALAPGMRAEDAAATLAVLTDTSFAVMLADDYGWGLDRIEEWMTWSLTELLAPGESPGL